MLLRLGRGRLGFRVRDLDFRKSALTSPGFRFTLEPPGLRQKSHPMHSRSRQNGGVTWESLRELTASPRPENPSTSADLRKGPKHACKDILAHWPCKQTRSKAQALAATKYAPNGSSGNPYANPTNRHMYMCIYIYTYMYMYF